VNADDVIDAQIQYYDLRAPDYLSPTAGPDRAGQGELSQAIARDLVDELAPTGDVLEIACGPGRFTAELARHAARVTAIDASPLMLERNRTEVASPNVSYIEADIFDWRPAQPYDVVFFGYWLSHVPPARFEEFWRIIQACVAENGRVAFVDEDDRATAHDDVRIIDGVPLARRTLLDGRQFDIVKVFWNANDLAAHLSALGWQFEIRSVDGCSVYAVGVRT
jgi:demethylmenaquinone methyltransferase/2-methoxy-6-polyprenyl-1,4-benzoquinol methylase